MYAIEFETDIKDRFIEIKEYEKVANKHARVILLIDSEIEDKEGKKGSRFTTFLKNTQAADSFQKYTREELHER